MELQKIISVNIFYFSIIQTVSHNIIQIYKIYLYQICKNITLMQSQKVMAGNPGWQPQFQILKALTLLLLAICMQCKVNTWNKHHASRLHLTTHTRNRTINPTTCIIQHLSECASNPLLALYMNRSTWEVPT